MLTAAVNGSREGKRTNACVRIELINIYYYFFNTLFLTSHNTTHRRVFFIKKIKFTDTHIWPLKGNPYKVHISHTTSSPSLRAGVISPLLFQPQKFIQSSPIAWI